jgi:pyruvate/2-oxoglutarate dehydrogenase complex dihydrolipoamide dehydrogenase (E3) component
VDRLTTDICIIGAGSGGLSLAAGAVQMGARVVLIEGGEMGGDCLNTGCVPSKALLAAGKAAQAARTAGKFGVRFGPPGEARKSGKAAAQDMQVSVDFAAAKDHVLATIAAIAPNDSQERFEAMGITVIRDYARFCGPREVEAGGKRIMARRIVIATGSHAAVPPIPGIDSVPFFTNETIFDEREAPRHLIVLGGGPIGLEMAMAHRRLGCEVTVIEGMRALSRDDPEAAAVVLAVLRGEGVTIHEGDPVVRVARGADDGIEVVLGNGETITGSHLLVAAGRIPVLDKLDLGKAGVATTPRGVSVGANLRSVSNRRVYAIGDAAGGAQFTHAAGAHAGVVIRQMLLGLPAKAAVSVPWVTYTEPELAQCGLTEAQARQTYGERVVILRAELSHNDRAMAEGKAQGFVKVMAVAGRPVGATIVGAQAGELIAFWALAISQRIKLSAIAGVILPYPTLAESAKRAAGAYFSAQLFDNPRLKQIVRLVQRFVP